MASRLAGGSEVTAASSADRVMRVSTAVAVLVWRVWPRMSLTAERSTSAAPNSRTAQSTSAARTIGHARLHSPGQAAAPSRETPGHKRKCQPSRRRLTHRSSGVRRATAGRRCCRPPRGRENRAVGRLAGVPASARPIGRRAVQQNRSCGHDRPPVRWGWYLAGGPLGGCPLVFQLRAFC